MYFCYFSSGHVVGLYYLIWPHWPDGAVWLVLANEFEHKLPVIFPGQKICFSGAKLGRIPFSFAKATCHVPNVGCFISLGLRAKMSPQPTCNVAVIKYTTHIYNTHESAPLRFSAVEILAKIKPMLTNRGEFLIAIKTAASPKRWGKSLSCKVWSDRMGEKVTYSARSLWY